MRSPLLLASALAAVASPTLAAPSDEPTPVDEVIVTATRLPTSADQVVSGRVLTDRTIRDRGAVFAADILADVPGLSVYRAGFGGVASVRMRGASQDKTLVLVDGVPVNDPSQPAGGFDFAGFDLGDVRRIEVLSGPQSSLWGSDAIGGVIAFTTREADGVSAEAEAGSYGTVRGRVSTGVATERYAAGLFASRFETDGVSAADEADGNTERDGLTTTTVGLNGRYEFDDRFGIDLRARRTETDADIDDFGPVDSLDTTASTTRSGLVRLRVGDVLGLDHRVTLAGSDIVRDTVSAFPSTYEGEHRLVRWQADGRGDGALTYSFGAEREETRADLNGASASLDVDSLFATAAWRAEALTLTVGLRRDETGDFGGKTTGRASATYALGGGFSLGVAYGTGFKTPSVGQAVCDFCFILTATPPVLVPETARSLEGELRWRSGDGRFDARATAYRLRVRNQIDGVFDPGTFEFYYVNIYRTRTDGIELQGRAEVAGGFALDLSYAWTDAVNETTGRPILRVPEHAGSATLGWGRGRLSGALTVRAEGEMPDSGGMRNGFVTANLNGAYALTPRVAFTVRIENLADRRYQQLLGYGEPGRSAYLGVRLRY